MGLKVVGKSASATLRAAVDDPDFRNGRQDKRSRRLVPTFCSALYKYLGSTVNGRNVHARVVAPAEFKMDDLVFLDPVKFALSMDAERAAAGEAPSAIAPSSEEEAIALFALAFALLQPDEAREISNPVLSLGARYEEFFSVTEAVEFRGQTVRSSPILVTDNTVEGLKPHTSEETYASKNVGGVDVGEKTSDAATNPGIVEQDRDAGVRTRSLFKAQQRLETTRSRRKELGAETELRLDEFLKFHEREEEALSAFRSAEAAVRGDFLAAQSRLLAVANREAITIQHFMPTATDARSIANWMDRCDIAVGRILALADELADKRSELLKLGANVPQPLRPSALSLDSVAGELETRSRALESEIAVIESWRSDLASFEAEVADCVSPREATSLSHIEAQRITSLVYYAQYRESLQALVPLLLRLLDGSEPETVLAELLKAAMLRAEAAGDRDDYQEAISFLPKPTLQRLLSHEDEVLNRIIILAVFQESIARSQPWFVTDFWDWESGWLDRKGTVGERLWRLFAALHKLYWREQKFSEVVSALAQGPDTSRRFEDVERTLVVSKQQAAHEVAGRLECPITMRGHFFRLRDLAASLFFRPIAPLVRERDTRRVQAEVAQLEHRFRDGSLEEQVLQGFGDQGGDRRELRADHRNSLRRYIENNLEHLRGWLRDELADARTSVWDDQVLDEVQNVASHLPIASDPRVCEPGSIAWLETRIGSLIGLLRQGERPEPTLAFFGELPSSDLLFTASNGDVHMPSWPAWLDRNPRAERCWVTHLKGKFGWKALLQDGIAAIVLRRLRSPSEVLESLLSCGEFEAGVQTAGFSEFNSNATTGLLERAEQLAARREGAEQRCYDLEKQLRKLAKLPGIQMLQRERIKELDAALLDAFFSLEQGNVDEAIEREHALGRGIADLKLQTDVADRERSEHLELRKAFLNAAGINVRSETTLEELETLSEKVLEKAKRRRAYLIRLRELDVPGVPDNLRHAVDEFARDADWPDRWPDESRGKELEDRVEFLVVLTQDWWSLQRRLEPEDITYRKILQLASVFADRVPSELRAIAAGRDHEAILLDLLVSQRRSTPAEFHAVLQTAGLVQIDTTQPLTERTVFPHEEPGREREIEAEGSALTQALSRIEEMLIKSPAVSDEGSGEIVQSAYTAFASGRYFDSCDLAAAAWRFARTRNLDKDLGPLAAIFGWSEWNSHDHAYERLDVDCLGLLFRYFPRISERAKEFGRDKLLRWLVEIVDREKRLDADEDIGTNVPALMLALAKAPTGSDSRDRFRAILRIAGSLAIGSLLWDSVRGLDTQWRARAALLLLLFDFGEEEALRDLFRRTGDQSKYLVAFTALASRIRQEPATRLQPALVQSYRTIEQSVKERAFKEFAREIIDRVRFLPGQVRLEVQAIAERGKRSREYRLVVRIVPDQTDPPLSLRVEFLETADFSCGEGQTPSQEVTRETPVFEPREIEYSIRKRTLDGATIVVLRAWGETASGQKIDDTTRHRIELQDSEEAFEPLTVDTLLDIYEGYDGAPVSGAAFVGRDEQLAMLERAVGREKPGAVVVYGVRRLGKTSLLWELRRRHCLTSRKGSRTLFLTVPMDEFSFADTSRSFLDRFLKHIQMEVLLDSTNDGFRDFLRELGVSNEELQKAAKPEPRLEGGSFLMQLREYLQNLRRLARGRVEGIVLLFDEFDKLLEHYRKGHEADVEELTNQLRRAATEEKDLGVVLAGSDLMEIILGQYRNAMFGSASRLRLECFDRAQDRVFARAIIAPESLKGRRRFSDAVLDQIVQITGGHPLFMRLVACAAVYLSPRRNISHGTVAEAVGKLLRNEVLQGYLIDPQQQVLQSLQVLTVLGAEDDRYARVILLQLARHTTLERPGARWSAIVQDDRLLSLKPLETWTNARGHLRDARLIAEREGVWSFCYPILGELLRVNLESEFDRLVTAA